MNLVSGHAIHLCRVWGSRHGGSLFSRALVDELHSLGWRVTAMAEQFVTSARPATEVKLPGLFGRSVGGLEHLRAIFRLFRILKSDERTVLIVQGDVPRLSYILLQFWTPFIFIRQDGILTCPGNNRFLHSSRSVCNRRASPLCFLVDRRQHCFGGGSLVARMGRLVFRLRDRVLLKGVRHFVTVSHYLQKQHRQSAQVLYPPLLIHGSVARIGRTSPNLEAPLKTNEKTELRALKTLVFCGRLEPSKGALEALSILRLLPGCYRLVILGDGPELERLSHLVAEWNLGTRVELKGWVDAETRDKALRSAGALLLPSLCDEGFGMVGLEAFAQGTPVVAYDVGGIPEWCRYPAGILVPAGNIPEAAAAVLAITEDPARWRVHSQAGRRLVEVEFPPERFRRDLEGLLARACGGAPAD